MELAAHAGIARDHIHRVAVRLAVVDDDRQIKLLRQTKLHLQNLLLQLLPLQIVVIVQADLADGLHLFLLRPRADARLARVVPAFRLVRMPADGGIEEIVALRQRHAGLVRPGVLARVHHKLHAVFRKRRDKLLAVGVEPRIVVVGMRIKKHTASPPFFRQADYSKAGGKMQRAGPFFHRLSAHRSIVTKITYFFSKNLLQSSLGYV